MFGTRWRRVEVEVEVGRGRHSWFGGLVDDKVNFSPLDQGRWRHRFVASHLGSKVRLCIMTMCPLEYA